ALGFGLGALVYVLRGRSVRIDSALVPPPWRLREGLVVLVRGAGAGVLVLIGFYAIGRWRGPNDHVTQELPQHLQRPRTLVVDGLGHPRGQTVGELELVQRANRGLVGQVLHDPRRADVVVDVHPPVDEDALFWDLHVVEDHEGVLFVEA